MKVETARTHAMAAATYVDSATVGLDPFTIITIITTILPIIGGLFKQCGQRNASEFCSTYPMLAQLQIRREARKAARDHGTPITQPAAGEIASGVVDYIFAADPEEVAAALAE